MYLTKRDYGKLCRKLLILDISKMFGDLSTEGSWFKSSINESKILVLYSDLNNDRWFYGIIEKYWRNWDQTSYIALLMRDGNRCSYVLINPKESIDLISRINLSKDNSKKINVRIPSVGKIYIQEWQDFPFADRVKTIGDIDPEMGAVEKLAKNLGLTVETLKRALSEANLKL
jgi:hypothetical protein